MAEPENERKERKTESGAIIVEGVAPQAGTKLTPERMAKNLRSLHQRWGQEKIAEQAERIEQLEEALKHYADEDNWDDDYEDGHWAERVIWRGLNDKGTFPSGPDLALAALSDLKKEEET